ncbi:ADP-ribosylglycohydrolase family protein [bacterium]|nr:MAG: ADP-ribosylglycohydrolase family protein [bacterium]
MKEKVLGGLFGLSVGDALGVPVEFSDRKILEKDPIIGMSKKASGEIPQIMTTYKQPPGTWSDDSSLTFCLAESLINGFDLRRIGDKFVSWYLQGYWTPHGKLFDIGGTTAGGIRNLRERTKKPEDCGLKEEHNSTNGSLMRILPMAFYVKDKPLEEQFELTHLVSRLTHGHPRSQMACGMYVQMAINLLNGDNLEEAYAKMRSVSKEHYAKSNFREELKHFSRILDDESFPTYQKEEIHSDGYVVHTLEASLWSLLRTNSYKDAVLTAVNLGGDTDTTAAIAGGLAGTYYGYRSIPKEWIETLARKEDIKKLAERFYEKIYEGPNA